MIRETHKSEWRIAGYIPFSPGQVANAWGVRYRSHALTAWRAGRKVIQRIAGMLPPALVFNEFAASLGALRALVKRAKARHKKETNRGAREQKFFYGLGRRTPYPTFILAFAIDGLPLRWGRWRALVGVLKHDII